MPGCGGLHPHGVQEMIFRQDMSCSHFWPLVLGHQDLKLRDSFFQGITYLGKEEQTDVIIEKGLGDTESPCPPPHKKKPPLGENREVMSLIAHGWEGVWN